MLNTAVAESEALQMKLGAETKKEMLLVHVLFNRTNNTVFLSLALKNCLREAVTHLCVFARCAVLTLMPLGFQEVDTSRISRQSAHEGGKVNPTHRPPLPPRRYSWYSFLLEAEST